MRRTPGFAFHLLLALATTTVAGTFPHRLVPHDEIPATLATLGPTEIDALERLNRADRNHLPRLEALLVPSVIEATPLAYSPFPHDHPEARASPKLLVVDLAWQAFAAYEHGRLVRWGPVSSGRRAAPTPTGTFHLTWRSRGRHSTVNPHWYMPWYFNFENRRGLALHAYALPGRPASHACIRMREEDARWLYAWGDEWKLAPDGRTVDVPGTAVIVHGTFDADEPPPWLSAERLATGAAVPSPGTSR